MSLPQRRNLIPVLVAAAAVALTLVGANHLIHPDPTSPAAGGNPAGGKQGTNGRGAVVLGTVFSAPLAAYGLPETMSSGRIRKIIDDNADVQIGTVLIEFDDTLPKHDLAQAEAAVKIAETKLLQAKMKEADFQFDLALQELAVKGATEEYRSALDALTLGKDKQEALLNGTNPLTAVPFTEPEKAKVRKENVEILKGEATVRLLAIKVEAEQKKLEKAKALKPVLLVQEAEFELARYKALAAKAKTAVDSCVVKAALAGRVGQVLASPGAVIYPIATPPVLVVPAGPRYVRAEVEPEFAHKLAGSEGKAVVVYDNNNFNLTYAGSVKQIGHAFLPKRTQGIDALTGNAPKVLEVVIEITDPTPAGKPPLLVGQPVRVSFP